MTRLSDLIVPIERINPVQLSSSTFDYIDISAIDSISKTITSPTRTKVCEAPSRARQLVYPGDILVSTVRPTLNAVALVPENLEQPIASTGFCVLRTRVAVLIPEYLYYFVKTESFIQMLGSRQKGGAYPAVSDEDVVTLQIPLPPLSEQRRIVEILQEAEEIRRLRAQAEAKTAELIPAMFHNHFDQGLDLNFEPLHSLADVVSGVAIGRKTKGMTQEVPYLRVANVQAGFVDLEEVKTTPATDDEVERFGLKNGDVLLTEGGDFDKLGRGCLWSGQVMPCIHQNHVFRVRPFTGKLNSRFFAHYLQSDRAKHYFLRCAKKTTNLASINLTQLQALPVPRISIVDQERFERQIQVAAACEVSANDKTFRSLTSSLFAHAFSGQLTAEWRKVNHNIVTQEIGNNGTR